MQSINIEEYKQILSNSYLLIDSLLDNLHSIDQN